MQENQRIFLFYEKTLKKGGLFVQKSSVNRCFLEIGVTAAVLLVPAAVEAATGIDAGGRRIHASIVSVGKWVIIIKGSIDCIQSVLSGDVQLAKRQFFGYLMCFGIMLALPWGLNEIEAIFK
jgi:hypothetical protein